MGNKEMTISPKAIAAGILLWVVFVMIGILAVDAANMQYSKATRNQIAQQREIAAQEWVMR
jgi:hypothetical protein